ncbi:RNA polymerase sigma factor RpoD/SigA [Streptomyces sp. NBC_01615]|uniref:sigma-70 family RNA polymerase sigma factor n=1 Tax=Streptomyces sp. NBC_01615 TaxID=2975898 RepID=UPI00386E7E44
MRPAERRSINEISNMDSWDRVVGLLRRFLTEGVDLDFAVGQVVTAARLDLDTERRLVLAMRTEGWQPAEEPADADEEVEPPRGEIGNQEDEVDLDEPFEQLEGPAPDSLASGTRIRDLDAARAAGRTVLEQDRWKANPQRRVLTAEQEVGLCLLMRSHASPTGALPEGYVIGLLRDGEPYRAYAALVEHNLKLVHSILRGKGFAGEAISYEDLVQHGILGLMHAIELFDISKGFKLSTYATWWIRQSISRALANEGSIIRLPVHVRERIEKVRRTEEKFLMQGRPPDLMDLVLACNLPLATVRDSLRLSRRRVHSMDSIINENTTLADLIVDAPHALPGPEVTLQPVFDREVLLPLLKGLTKRTASVLLYRYGFVDGERWTLEQVGREFGVTRERIRQIEKMGLKELRIQLGAAPDDPVSARRRLRAAKQRAERNPKAEQVVRCLVPGDAKSGADQASSMAEGDSHSEGGEGAVVPSEGSFGGWLHSQMRRCGMDDAALADRLHVTPALVRAWLDGRSIPREEVLEEVRSALVVSEEPAVEQLHGTPSARPAWYHRPAHVDGGREFGNAAAFAFDADLSVLAREATQNSLDERVDPQLPVRVRYILHELTGEHLRDFLDVLGWQGLEPHYEVAAGQRQKVGRVLAEGIRQLHENESLLLLRVEDYNATGLVGSDYGDSKFAAVVRDQLISNKSSDQAGGSYGLGKATLWGTSRIGLVLINSTLSVAHEGRTERRLVGRLELPWHKVEEREFAGPAWFGVPDGGTGREDIARSWWGDRETVEALHLTRDGTEPGTSFLVVGAHDAAGDTENLQDMHSKLVESLADNFWAAMTSGRDTVPMLEASVTALRDGRTVVEEVTVDPAHSQAARVRALRAYYDGETVDELTDTHHVAQALVPLRVPAFSSEPRTAGSIEHHAILLITPADDADREINRLVCMRGNRMSVVDRRVRDLPLGATPFQAVLLAGRATDDELGAAERAEAFLRAAEPPEHNDWNKTEELASTYARGARQRILDFRKAMDEAVRGLVGRRQESSSSGPEVLRELLSLDVPTLGRRAEGHPTIRHVEGGVDSAGAWRVRIDVKLPDREDPWILEPVAKFDVRSGGRPQVAWAELTAGENCVVRGGLLQFAEGARRASFAGVTDVESHPVAATMARLIIDLQKARETSA